MFEIPNVKFAYLYPKPVNMRWGETKLGQICLKEMGLDPTAGDVFLFFNRAKDQMKLFFRDDDGSQEHLKMLPKGFFTLPEARDGEKYVKISRDKVGSLFRGTLLN